MKSSQPPAARFWTPQKIRIFCGTMTGLMIVYIFWTYITDVPAKSMLKRGDFSAFYAAAMMVRQGLGARLYDVNLVSDIQNLYWPSLAGGYIFFPYPPYVALVLAPLAWFPPLAAKFIFDILMVLALVLAVRLTARDIPALKKNPLAVTAFCLSFFPLTFGVAGGQNIALSMMLYAAVLFFFAQDNPRAEGRTGICLGLWLFKPQFGVVLAALFLLAGFYRVIGGMVLVAVVYYFLAVKVAGWGWIPLWLDFLKKYVSAESHYNYFNMISLVGFLDAAGQILGLGARGLKILHGLSALLSILMLGFLLWISLRLRTKKIFRRRADLLKLLRFAMPVILLASPHTLFYDFGLCLVAWAPYMDLKTDRNISLLIIFTALATMVSSVRLSLPVQPLFFGVAALLFYMGWKERDLLAS